LEWRIFKGIAILHFGAAPPPFRLWRKGKTTLLPQETKNEVRPKGITLAHLVLNNPDLLALWFA
jgi:hypothetical protein